jgi:hypothetical protein
MAQGIPPAVLCLFLLFPGIYNDTNFLSILQSLQKRLDYRKPEYFFMKVLEMGERPAECGN